MFSLIQRLAARLRLALFAPHPGALDPHLRRDIGLEARPAHRDPAWWDVPPR